MTNEELENRIRELTGSERKITREVLILIQEAEDRRMYLSRGYSSSFDWLVKEFKYTQASAYRRIFASRLLLLIPEAFDKLEQGDLNLTHLADVQSAVIRVEKKTGKAVSKEIIRTALSKIENLSTVHAQKEIVTFFPLAEVPKDTLRSVNANESRLSVVIETKTREALKRIKELLSHAEPEGGWDELIFRIADEYLNKHDPLRKMTRPASATEDHCVIPENTRRLILKRANGQCEFTDEQTSHRCECRHQIEIDHIVPKALGGGNEPENLRALCRAHNLYEAERVLGFRYQPKEHINGL